MYYIGNSIIRNGAIAPLSEQEKTSNDGEIYEMFRVKNGKPIFLPDHLKRYENSLRTAGGNALPYFDKLPSLIEWLILCNQITDGEIRLCLSPDGLFQGGFVPSAFPTPQMYEEGVHCVFLHDIRENPIAKIYHAPMRERAETQQKQNNAYESILVNNDGLITEGSRSNIFFTKANTIVTAPDNMVLNGIMRLKVLTAAKDLGIEVVYKAIDANTIGSYDGAFISSTPAQILPVKSITNTQFERNNKTISAITRAIEKLILD